jgi:hypothetical protein
MVVWFGLRMIAAAMVVGRLISVLVVVVFDLAKTKSFKTSAHACS